MAVLCPAYDPMVGWYILVSGPNGFQMKLIESPLHYYFTVGVKPPVGAVFTDSDYEDFECSIDLKVDYYDLKDPLVDVDIGINSNSSTAPVVPELGFSSLPNVSKSLLTTKLPNDCPPEYQAIIPEVGLPMPSLQVKCPLHAPVVPKYDGIVKPFVTEVGNETFSEDDKPVPKFKASSSLNHSSIYDPQFPTTSYNNNSANVLPLISKSYNKLYPPSYLSSQNDYDDDDDYDIETSYNDPYGKPHNM